MRGNVQIRRHRWGPPGRFLLGGIVGGKTFYLWSAVRVNAIHKITASVPRKPTYNQGESRRRRGSGRDRSKFRFAARAGRGQVYEWIRTFSRVSPNGAINFPARLLASELRARS